MIAAVVKEGGKLLIQSRSDYSTVRLSTRHADMSRRWIFNKSVSITRGIIKLSITIAWFIPCWRVEACNHITTPAAAIIYDYKNHKIETL